MRLRLVATQPEAGDAETLVFEPEQPVTWQAGQYLKYTLPHSPADDRGQERWFTISSAPYEGNIHITTRFFDKRSSFKSHLHDLKIGQDIEAGEPEGDFVITDPSKHYIFIAGGIGITPFRSILTQAAHDGQNLFVDLLYGNRTEEASIFICELTALAAKNPNIKIHNVLEPQRIDAELIKTLPDLKSKTYYVSGPEPMVEAFEKILSDLGIAEADQKRDYFPGYEWPTPAAPAA